jgi:hypothetical protein
MSVGTLGEIIAERVLTLVDENGGTAQVFVRLGKPQASPDSDEFHCTCQIVGIGDEKVHEIFGVDAFQALQLTFRYISFKHHHYRKRRNVALFAWERGDNMGFPEDPRDKESERPAN